MQDNNTSNDTGTIFRIIPTPGDDDPMKIYKLATDLGHNLLTLGRQFPPEEVQENSTNMDPVIS